MNQYNIFQIVNSKKKFNMKEILHKIGKCVDKRNTIKSVLNKGYNTRTDENNHTLQI